MMTIDPEHNRPNRMRVQSTQDLTRCWRSDPEGGHGHTHSMQTRWQGPGATEVVDRPNAADPSRKFGNRHPNSSRATSGAPLAISSPKPR